MAQLPNRSSDFDSYNGNGIPSEPLFLPSIGSILSDFYVNQKLSLKLDLPAAREPILDLFNRLKKEFPGLSTLRRIENEVALESDDQQQCYSWLSIGSTRLDSGYANPTDLGDAYRLHRKILELAPYFLSISPIDIDHLELIFGFDLEAQANRHAIVFDALMSDSPLAELIGHDEEVLESHPALAIALEPSSNVQAFIDVKARTTPRERETRIWNREPISVILAVRYTGALHSLNDLPACFAALAGHAERITEERLVPNIVEPIRQAIIAHPSF